MSDIITEAEELYEEAQDGWNQIYEAAKEDISFGSPDGEQWEAKDRDERLGSNRPALTINRIPQFIHQVTNDIRMNTPSINIIPEDDDADDETANAIKEWIRGIEYRSRADIAYDTAMENQVKGGIGFIRVDHDYTAETGFDQDVVIKRVLNPFSCYIDPSIMEPDGSDATFGFVLDKFTKRQFQKAFPGKKLSSFGAKETQQDREDYTVAEFFKLNTASKDIAMLEDGTILPYEEGLDGVRAKRSIKARSIKRYKLSGDEVLEETDFPGIYIPIVPVFGEEEWIDGKRVLRGLIRNAKDPQRMYNLWKSYEAEILLKSPIAPVMAAEGQTEEYANQWTNPHKSMVLRYKQVDVDGRPAPPPQRLNPAQIPTGMVNASMMAVDDLKATTGIYDASLGARGNEQSGKAINARQKEGDVSNFHFGDNLVRSISHVGRIIVNMRETIVDTPRKINGMGVDDKPTIIGVNGEIAGNQKKTFDFKKGKYGVRVTTGASFATKRQEAASFMQTVVANNPDLMSICGDILMRNMDVPGAEALAERFKMMLPPQIAKAEKAKEQGQEIDPEKIQLQQGMQTAVQEIQQLQQALAECQAELKNKQADHDIKMKELGLKEQELNVKKGEVGIQAYQAQYGSPEAPKAMERPPVDTGLESELKTPDQIAMEEAEAQKAIDLNKIETQLKIKEIQLEEQELQQQIAIAQAQQAQLDTITQQLAMLTAAINKPKTVMRDPETGAIVGVQ